MPPPTYLQTAVRTLASRDGWWAATSSSFSFFVCKVYLLPVAGVLDDCDFGALLLVLRPAPVGSCRILSCVFTLIEAKITITKPLPKILGKACRTRLFTYQELNYATKGFDHEQQLISIVDGTIHMGVIDDGSLVAVQKVNCENDGDR
ncbi:hypothetical protein M5K25_002198 [Dendrobium thyrsiflorum]|uniref:Uncharacterized protein n=1 Tax=Dendrobium thyrsiflorum TaxID=117978 RepID=A0ABD0VS89_DENTH